MTAGQNIKALRSRFDLSQEQLAERLGVTRESVTRWENGSMAIRDRHVAKMVELFGIDPDDIRSENNGLHAQLTGSAVHYSPVRLPGATPAKSAPTAFVPLRGKVHAGEWSEPDVLDEELVAIPQRLVDSDPDTYVCVVEGDCMSRVYPEGCLIAVSPNSTPHNGSVAVVSIDYGDAMMRKLFRTSKTLVLSPDSYNDAYDDIVITSEQDHVIEFGGKVVWFQPAGEME